MKNILFLLLFTTQIYASGHICDLVIINSDTLMLFSEPLHEYYKKYNINTDSLFKGFERSSACFDGHFAVWEIIQNVLYLKEIINPGYYTWVNLTEDHFLYKLKPDSLIKNLDLSTLFKKKYIDGYVKADWFNGTIKIVGGKQLWYVHLGFYSYYENESILEVKNGDIINWSMYKNKPIINNNESEIDDHLDLIFTLPENIEHCYFLKKSNKLSDTICYCNPQETVVLKGDAEYFKDQKNQVDQILGNKVLLDSLVIKMFPNYAYDKYVTTKKKWHNVLYVDGWKENEYIRIYVEAKIESRHWFILSVKNISREKFYEYAEIILDNLVVSGL